MEGDVPAGERGEAPTAPPRPRFPSAELSPRSFAPRRGMRSPGPDAAPPLPAALPGAPEEQPGAAAAPLPPGRAGPRRAAGAGGDGARVAEPAGRMRRAGGSRAARAAAGRCGAARLGGSAGVRDGDRLHSVAVLQPCFEAAPSPNRANRERLKAAPRCCASVLPSRTMSFGIPVPAAARPGEHAATTAALCFSDARGSGRAGGAG